MAVPRNRVRVAGSGFTMFTFMGEPIAFAEQIGHTSAQPVAPATPIHPMDEPYAAQIITPAAAGPGTLVLQLTELYGSKVWERLGQEVGLRADQIPSPGWNNVATNQAGSGGKLLDNAVDIVDVFLRISRLDPGTVNVTKFIRAPRLYNDTTKPGAYVEQFMNCVISDIEDGEQVGVGTMQLTKNVTVMYTHTMLNNRLPEALRVRI
jgi:hypothetical protein